MSSYLLVKSKLEDYDFLKKVHHTTLREHISKIWGWNEVDQDQFFKESFDPGLKDIIWVNNIPVGYLELNVEVDAVTICDILILPEFQGNGLGKQIIKDLIFKTQSQQVKLQLGVFKVNSRAKKLYEILGFKVVGETDTHHLMLFTLD